MLYTADNTWKIGKPAKVYLDGEYMKDAFSADPDKGVVTVLKRGEDGDVCIDENGDFAREVRHGNVKVVFDTVIIIPQP